MTRCFTIALLAFALLGAFGYTPFVTPVHAQDAFGFGTSEKTPAGASSTGSAASSTPKPDTSVADTSQTNTSAPDSTTAKSGDAATPAVTIHKIPELLEPKHAVPTRTAIEQLITNGDFDGAESAYLEWENAWQQVDPDLLIDVESHILQKQYANGENIALIALVYAGDPDTLKTVRTMLRTGKTDLPPIQFATVVHALATLQQSPDYALLIKLLNSDDLDRGNIAIVALGDYGNKKAIPALISLLGEANLDRSILIAKSVMELGGKSQLVQRYTLELKSTFSGIPERASLMLAITGNSSSWDTVKKLLDEKNPGFYPQALSCIGNLQSMETESYIINALAASDVEQLDAIQSIDALSSDEVLPTLLKIINNKTKSLYLRLAALNQLAMQGTPEAMKALRGVAFADDKQIGDVIIFNAIYLLAESGQLNDAVVRASVHQLLFSEDKLISTAARGALYVYAANAPR